MLRFFFSCPFFAPPAYGSVSRVKDTGSSVPCTYLTKATSGRKHGMWGQHNSHSMSRVLQLPLAIIGLGWFIHQLALTSTSGVSLFFFFSRLTFSYFSSKVNTKRNVRTDSHLRSNRNCTHIHIEAKLKCMKVKLHFYLFFVLYYSTVSQSTIVIGSRSVFR